MTAGLIQIVDDDPLIRSALEQVLRGCGFDCRSYASAEAYLEAQPQPPVGCLILDLQLGAMDGLELEAQLRACGHTLPIIFLTGQATVTTAVDAVKRGAFDFLEKPFEADRLIEMVGLAVAESRRQAERHALLEKLTPREREVFDLLTAGKINKVIAAELDISMSTVEFHRARVMEKLNAQGLDDLIALSGASARTIG